MYLLTDKGIEYIKKKSLLKQHCCKHKIVVKGEHCLENGDTRIKYAEIFEVCQKCGKVFESYILVK